MNDNESKRNAEISKFIKCRSQIDKDPMISRRSFLALMGVGACLIGAVHLTGASSWDFSIPMR